MFTNLLYTASIILFPTDAVYCTGLILAQSRTSGNTTLYVAPLVTVNSIYPLLGVVYCNGVSPLLI